MENGVGENKGDKRLQNNRRLHQRFILDHPANLVVGGQPVTECRIRNYSKGGLCLQLNSAALAQLKIHNEDLDDEMVHALVRLYDEATGVELPFEIPVRIVFAGSQEYGVALMNPSRAVLSYLEEQHKNHSPSDGAFQSRTITPEQSQILDQVQKALVSHIFGSYPQFIEKLISKLLDISEQSSLQDQSTYTYAGTMIDQSKEELNQSLRASISLGWHKLLTRNVEVADQNANQQQLELVDQDEFDEWASVTVIARRLEGNLSETLHILSQSLAFVLRIPVTSDNNPLSPYSLLWAFKNALVALDLNPDARQVAYQVYSNEIIGDLTELYALTLDLFKKGGVTIGAELQSNTASKVENSPDSAPSLADSNTGQRKRKTLVNKLASLFGGKENTSVDQSKNATVATSEAVNDVLERFSSSDGKNLSNRIQQALGSQAEGEGVVLLSGESLQAIDATETLLSVAQQDPRHTKLTQAILNQIQVPLVKAAIDNPDVLNSEDGVSRQLLENIDQLALLMPSTAGVPQVQHANAELQKILAILESAGGQADLAAVSQQISELLDQRQNEFGANVQQVQAGCSFEQASNHHLAEIRNFLKEELTDNVSSLVDQMLRAGWAGLLADTANQGYGSSKALKAYKNALILLNRVYQPKNSSASLETRKFARLEQVLRRGFDAYPIHKCESDILVDQIGQANSGDLALFKQFNRQRVSVNEAYLDELLPESSASPSIDSEQDIEGEWLARVEQIQDGDWIANHQQQGQIRLLNLIWIDPLANRYVFVDGTGAKVLDCCKNDLAQNLKAGIYSIIEDGGLPMIERAVDVALRQTFERLRGESDLDDITGLPNRRAHERALQNLLKVSKKEDSAHVLICVDLDNFSLVNDLCGFDGGDHLLSGVANVCKSYLNNKGNLARTGDSEYRVLVKYCSVDEGFRVAESLRKAIENFRFDWAGRKVSVTASIGFTEITSIGGHQNHVIQAATLACQQAKKEGRNCTRRYQPDGAVFAQRKRMAKSIPLIEKALEHDQLDLHAQLISPIFVGDGHNDHHEILLRCFDDEGRPGSPYELIEAAEQYDRMRSVDRWVVQRFFNWAETALKTHTAESMGAFSINLSGESMTDEAFHEFLIAKVKASSFPTHQLSFELTETTLVSQVATAHKLITQLKALGCTLFLDDFGSGYANYSYLKDFPIDVVKIDGVFVKNIHEDKTSYAMVKSITEVAHHLGKLVVAEFVENEAILNALRKLEVDFAQGYCLGRPAPLDSLLQRYAF